VREAAPHAYGMSKASQLEEGWLQSKLDKYPFASTKNIVSHFDIGGSTMKDLFARELGLCKFTRRWVPHSLSERQKNKWVTQSRVLLDLLQRHQTADFNAIAIEDQSWFRYVCPTCTIYARSRSDVTYCVRSGIGTSKGMITSFPGSRVLVEKALPTDRKLNLDYFFQEVLSSLFLQQRSNRRQKSELDFVVHRDNSMCHNTRKINRELEQNKIERAPHPAYSPDLTAGTFGLLVLSK
jgi:hypothetical protein